jgi:CheY-like chemotaxis protein/HPt (histidine-containing phosphotransfer) domain-containing protein
VLVVDDHPINRKLLARQLGLLGLRVETAPDGNEALPLWRAGRYALVITDCHMPGIDGYELAHAIRTIEADEARARTPIFAWTANALADEVDKCEAAGMDELLVKPADLAQLKRMLEKWLPTAAQAAPDQPEAPRAPPAGAAPPPLDLSALTIMCGEDSAAVRESLLEFRRINDQDAAQLRQAVAQDDLERVMHATHRMLGSSGIVGAHELAGACRNINHASRAGDSETVAEGMQALESEVQRLNAYIDSLCAH